MRRAVNGSIQPVPPSGEQIELRHGDQVVVVVEVGGALRAYTTGDGDLLDGYEVDEMCTGGRGQSLIPWPNRVKDGVYEWRGERQQVPLNEPDKHNAIHGLARYVNWSVAERSSERAVMSHRLHPQPGWPFALDLQIEYSLGDAGLTVRTSATNVGVGDCPYGAGAHPYLTLGTDKIDALVVQAPGQRYMSTDDQQIPTASEPVDGTQFDFRQARQLGDTVLDTGYSDLNRDDDGVARVRVATSDGSRRATLWLDGSYDYLMLFTGDSLPQPERRRRGLGIEPMTCAPNALQSGDGLRTLAPGESFSGAWGITPGA